MKTSRIIIIALVVLILNAGITLVLINQKEAKTPATTTTMVNPSHNQRHNEITSAVQAVEPAVVSVNVTKTQLVRPGFGFSIFDFFGDIPIQRQVVSIGSGVIYDANGYIITNAHVIECAEKKGVLPDTRNFIRPM
jgi:serine protease Do